MKNNLQMLVKRTIYFTVLIVLAMVAFVKANVSQVTEYPNTDEYFDRVFILQNGINSHYLRLYCK